MDEAGKANRIFLNILIYSEIHKFIFKNNSNWPVLQMIILEVMRVDLIAYI
jgi:hypothetical protein